MPPRRRARWTRRCADRRAGRAALHAARGPHPALHPDLILTQALCEVCAVVETDVRALAATLRPPPRVITLSATSLDGVLEDIRTWGLHSASRARPTNCSAGAQVRMRTVHETLKAARPRARAWR
jgi:iron complex transport system substrate-binding protein